MESKLDLIITQNWMLLVLALILVAMNILCGYINLKNKRSVEGKPKRDLIELWDKGEFEELEKRTKGTLENYPNDIDSLYYLGKVLARRGENEQAIELWEKVRQSNPELHSRIGGLIENIRRKETT